MTTKQCVTWDLIFKRIKTDGTEYTADFIGQTMKKVFKKYVFQPETGHKTGFRHFQFRGSLIKKTYKGPLLKLLCDALKCSLDDCPTVQPTILENHNSKNFDYVLKSDSREGDKTYTDVDFEHEELKQPEYIPRQYRGIIDKLYPYQKKIMESAKDFEVRKINFIYNPLGNVGKSTISALCELYADGIDLPPFTNYDKILESMCDICMSRNLRRPSPVLFDMPRSIDTKDFSPIFTAIEQIKKGKLSDPRHSYKQWWIDSPQVWVFSNILPDLKKYLSLDRWIIWTIKDNFELVPLSFDESDDEENPLDIINNEIKDPEGT